MVLLQEGPVIKKVAGKAYVVREEHFTSPESPVLHNEVMFTNNTLVIFFILQRSL